MIVRMQAMEPRENQGWVWERTLSSNIQGIRYYRGINFVYGQRSRFVTGIFIGGIQERSLTDACALWRFWRCLKLITFGWSSGA